MSRRVNQIYMYFILRCDCPRKRDGGRLNCDAAVSFLRHVIHYRVALINLTRPPRVTSQMQHLLCYGRLSSVNVRNYANISQASCRHYLASIAKIKKIVDWKCLSGSTKTTPSFEASQCHMLASIQVSITKMVAIGLKMFPSFKHLYNSRQHQFLWSRHRFSELDKLFSKSRIRTLSLMANNCQQR